MKLELETSIKLTSLKVNMCVIMPKYIISSPTSDSSLASPGLGSVTFGLMFTTNGATLTPVPCSGVRNPQSDLGFRPTCCCYHDNYLVSH